MKGLSRYEYEMKLLSVNCTVSRFKKIKLGKQIKVSNGGLTYYVPVPKGKARVSLKWDDMLQVSSYKPFDAPIVDLTCGGLEKLLAELEVEPCMPLTDYDFKETRAKPMFTRICLILWEQRVGTNKTAFESLLDYYVLKGHCVKNYPCPSRPSNALLSMELAAILYFYNTELINFFKF